MDANQLNNQLWTGGAIVAESDIVDMVNAGINADIDCRLEFDDKSLIDEFENFPPAPPLLKAHPSISYFYAGVADDGLAKPPAWFQGGWAFAQPVLRAGGVVLSHCAAGCNRGPSMAYFLLRVYWGMAANDAFALIVSKRPQALVGYRSDADNAIQVLAL